MFRTIRVVARPSGLSLLLGAILVFPLDAGAERGGRDKSLPVPARSGIQHIVVVMMENRSFDHFFGWMPEADGMQAGLVYEDDDGSLHETAPLAPDYMGCDHPDPDHTWEGGRIQRNDGAMDGFLLSGANDSYSIGYYTEADRPFHSALAREFTVFDRYFSSHLGSTFPNRIFQYAAQTDRLENSLDLSTLPTIWDRLVEAGVPSKYYFSDVPFLLLWGAKYIPLFATYADFLADAAEGALPAVSFLDPRFIDEATGTSGDDHPHADIRTGDAFLSEAFHAVASGPGWKNTVFIVTYDEWGGFFDHVPPPRAAAPNGVDPDIVGGKALLGFRIPVVVASPWTRSAGGAARVVSDVYDHASILKLIEWRWNLRPLTARDASSDVGNLVRALDFARPDASVPELPRPQPPSFTPCPFPFPDDEVELPDIATLWPLASPYRTLGTMEPDQGG
jgi:phospholipase C